MTGVVCMRGLSAASFRMIFSPSTLISFWRLGSRESSCRLKTAQSRKGLEGGRGVRDVVRLPDSHCSKSPLQLPCDPWSTDRYPNCLFWEVLMRCSRLETISVTFSLSLVLETSLWSSPPSLSPSQDQISESSSSSSSISNFVRSPSGSLSSPSSLSILV